MYFFIVCVVANVPFVVWSRSKMCPLPALALALFTFIDHLKYLTS